MPTKHKILSLVTSVLMTFAMVPASAAVINFAQLPDFQNYTQAGMQMQSNDVWNWPGNNMAHMDSGTATFSLNSGADFSLTSVEMIASGGNGPARFSAYNNGILLGSTDISGSAGVFMFSSIFSRIDQFQVSVIGTHFTFDNINFGAAVPEPTTVALLGLGLLGVAASRRKAAKN